MRRRRCTGDGAGELDGDRQRRCSRAPWPPIRSSCMPSGDEVTELRLSVPAGKRHLLSRRGLAQGRAFLRPIAKGDDVLVYGQLVRRFYRSGAARSLTEVIAAGIKSSSRSRRWTEIGVHSVEVGAVHQPVRGLGQKNVDLWGSRSPRSITSRIRAASVGGRKNAATASRLRTASSASTASGVNRSSASTCSRTRSWSAHTEAYRELPDAVDEEPVLQRRGAVDELLVAHGLEDLGEIADPGAGRLVRATGLDPWNGSTGAPGAPRPRTSSRDPTGPGRAPRASRPGTAGPSSSDDDRRRSSGIRA